MSYSDRNRQEEEAARWWSGGAEAAAKKQQEAAEQNRIKEEEWNQINWWYGTQRQGAQTYSTHSSALSRLIYSGLIAVLLAFGVEFAAAALQQFLIKASAAAQGTPPTMVLYWVLYTGRLFSGLTTLVLLTNWFFSLFGRGCLGGFIRATAILVFLLFLSGLVTALLVTWLNATGKIA